MNSYQAKNFWNNVYSSKTEKEVSWFSTRLNQSISQIEKYAFEKSHRIIDVGSGRSTLVDDLLQLGYRSITIFDVSNEAIEQTISRTNKASGKICAIVGDATNFKFEERGYDVWHDRAVFHFLLSPNKQQAYVRTLKTALCPGGKLIISTFSLSGPDKCSGLDVIRYSKESLSATLGDDFVLLDSQTHLHLTPFDAYQEFLQCCYEYVGQ